MRGVRNAAHTSLLELLESALKQYEQHQAHTKAQKTSYMEEVAAIERLLADANWLALLLDGSKPSSFLCILF